MIRPRPRHRTTWQGKTKTVHINAIPRPRRSNIKTKALGLYNYVALNHARTYNVFTIYMREYDNENINVY